MSYRILFLCWISCLFAIAPANAQEDTSKFKRFFTYGIHLTIGANPFSNGLQIGGGTQLSYQILPRLSLTYGVQAAFYEDLKDYRFINLVERPSVGIAYLEIRDGVLVVRNFQVNLPFTLRWEIYQRENHSWFFEGSWHRIYELGSTRWFDYQEAIRYLSESRDPTVPPLLTIRTNKTTTVEHWTGFSIGMGFKVRPESKYPFSVALHYHRNRIRHRPINPTTHELFTLQINFSLFSFGGFELLPPQ